jgi:hypothetical protein
MRVASGLERGTGSQLISSEVEDDWSLNTEELTRIVNVVDVHIKAFSWLPDIGLDMNAVSRRCWAPSGRRELVPIPAGDLA